MTDTTPPAGDAAPLNTNIERTPEEIAARARAFQGVVEQAIADAISPTAVIAKLKNQGATPDEARDYLEQFENLRKSQPPVEGDTNNGDEDPILRAPTPEGLNGQEREDYRARRKTAVDAAAARQAAAQQKTADEVAWVILEAAAEALEQSRAPGGQTSPLPGASGVPALPRDTLPASVLSAAPHLASLTSGTGNVHLDKTWELRKAFQIEKALEAVLDVVMQQRVDEPMARSFWRDIVLDKYTDFSKLLASFEKGTDPYDEPAEFGSSGFVIFKKEHVHLKKPVNTEAEWIRTFSAWKGGVNIVYPHRKSELDAYQKIIMQLFRATPQNPHAAIRFDKDARERYSRGPFRLDDRSELDISLFSQLLQPAPPVYRPNKRANSPGNVSGGAKRGRKDENCLNWNSGYCETTCPNNRKHGICCECAGNHRARDNTACDLALAERKKRNAGARTEDGGRSGRTGQARG